MTINVFTVESKIFVSLLFTVRFHIWSKFRDWWTLTLRLNERMKERRNEGTNVRKYWKYEETKERTRGGREERTHEGTRVQTYEETKKGRKGGTNVRTYKRTKERRRDGKEERRNVRTYELTHVRRNKKRSEERNERTNTLNETSFTSMISLASALANPLSTSVDSSLWPYKRTTFLFMHL